MLISIPEKHDQFLLTLDLVLVDAMRNLRIIHCAVWSIGNKESINPHAGKKPKGNCLCGQTVNNRKD